MPTNAERRQKIAELRKQLHLDLVALEKKHKENRALLEKTCSRAVFDLELAIQADKSQEIQAARQRILQVIEASGVRLEDVLASLPRPRGPMKPSTVTHRGPGGKIWNGRGRRPQWFRQGNGNDDASLAA